MKRFITFLFCLVLFALSVSSVFGGDNTLYGRISNITSVPEGMLIKMDTGAPNNCQGTPWGWMLIPEANKTIISVTLLAKAMGKNASVYTYQFSGTGYCQIWQVDPDE